MECFTVIAKQELEHLLASQPADATKGKLIRELAFELMVQRGVADSDAGKTMSNEEIQHRIILWPR
jgi:predicted transcriptional regulator